MVKVATPAGELWVRAENMVSRGAPTRLSSWEVDGPVEVAATPTGKWGILREEWITPDICRALCAEAAADSFETPDL